MYTIWFRTPNMLGSLSVEVSETFAADVWDSLAKQFEMISARP